MTIRAERNVQGCKTDKIISKGVQVYCPGLQGVSIYHQDPALGRETYLERFFRGQVVALEEMVISYPNNKLVCFLRAQQ